MPMTPEQVDAFLAESHLCHFATIDERGRSRVRPLWYLWRDRTLWFTTRTRVRHTGTDLQAHPDVAVSIASEERPYRAVVVHGRPQIVGKDEQILTAIATRYGEEEGRAFVAEAMAQDDRVVMKLEPRTLISWDYGQDD